MTLEQFTTSHPELFFLQEEKIGAISRYLKSLGVLQQDEAVVAAESAGEGNMNLTVRVQIEGTTTGNRSLIVKQSRPWVEKYPQIEAPWDRVLGEARFYLLTSAHERVSARLPNLIEIDTASRVMILEDLGRSRDYTGLYDNQPLDHDSAVALAEWLSELHCASFQEKSQASLTNLPMRHLNHEHLFHFPLREDNGLALDEITVGLAGEAQRLINDHEYRTRVAALGEIYLGTGPSLLHGDFFPGSWLKTSRGPVIIDPEFAFFGATEFDLGVLLGHLYLANQKEIVHTAVIENYRPPAGFDWRLALEFCAVEIMRRLIGVAQLPLSLNFESKKQLLRLSQELIVAEDPLACALIKARVPIIKRAGQDDELQNDSRSA